MYVGICRVCKEHAHEDDSENVSTTEDPEYQHFDCDENDEE